MMKSGTYYIGDLCYIMHSEWNAVCKLITSGNCVNDGEFTLSDGRKFAIYSTQYGDGIFNASNGSALPVDAGLIGCILLSDIELSNTENDITSGTVVKFDTDFITSSDDDGNIYFGHICVITRSEEEDYDAYADEDYDNYADEKENDE